ncbi:MAG TPA: hypothetical protein VFD00_11395 [Thermoclostridium sp.]|nr:hypothetical protein [Thermoclostridium sp.]
MRTLKTQLAAIPAFELIEMAEEVEAKIALGSKMKISFPPELDDDDVVINELINRYKLKA